MFFFTLIFLVASAVASSLQNGLYERDAAGRFCAQLKGSIRGDKDHRVATVYCSSFLGIPAQGTTTKVRTRTVTVGAIRTAITGTNTEARDATTIETVTIKSKSTTTITEHTTITTDLSTSTTTQTATCRGPTGVNAPKIKRAIAQPSFLSTFTDPAALSSACSCLYVQPRATKEAAVTTVTSTTTVTSNVRLRRSAYSQYQANRSQTFDVVTLTRFNTQTATATAQDDAVVTETSTSTVSVQGTTTTTIMQLSTPSSFKIYASGGGTANGNFMQVYKQNQLDYYSFPAFLAPTSDTASTFRIDAPGHLTDQASGRRPVAVPDGYSKVLLLGPGDISRNELNCGIDLNNSDGTCVLNCKGGQPVDYSYTQFEYTNLWSRGADDKFGPAVKLMVVSA